MAHPVEQLKTKIKKTADERNQFNIFSLLQNGKPSNIEEPLIMKVVSVLHRFHPPEYNRTKCVGNSINGVTSDHKFPITLTVNGTEIIYLRK